MQDIVELLQVAKSQYKARDWYGFNYTILTLTEVFDDNEELKEQYPTIYSIASHIEGDLALMYTELDNIWGFAQEYVYEHSDYYDSTQFNDAGKYIENLQFDTFIERIRKAGIPEITREFNRSYYHLYLQDIDGRIRKIDKILK